MLGVSSAGDGIRSTVWAEKSSGLSMEDSSCSAECKLDLGLGLGIGRRDGYLNAEHDRRSRFSRILMDQDMGSAVSLSSSASSSTSSVCSSSLSNGTRRRADSLEGDSNGASQSQLVGWPPLRISRMNSIGNRSNLSATEDLMNESGKCSNTMEGESHGGGRSSLFVKVNMDGIPIGRKVNLIAHSSYKTLVQTLEDMFQDPTTPFGSGKILNLLRKFSKYALAYEDKDGDWMLVGDVPWGLLFYECFLAL